MTAALITVVGPTLIAVLVWFIKLPTVISKNTEAVNELSAAIKKLSSKMDDQNHRLDEHETRHDIAQKLFSDILDHPVDTKSLDKYPPTSLFRKPRPS